jgi:phosphatidylserine/phosphatidylglycerophosphate/cardiolipin synthase-like enzyme
MNGDKVTLLVTGLELFDPSIRSINSAVQELICEAKNEIVIVAYLLTSGASSIIDRLRETAEKGVKITLLIDTLESHEKTIIEKLKLLAGYPNVQILSFSDPQGAHLHAKVIVVDRRKAVIGSANLSWGGMVANYEVGVLIEGETAWKLAKTIDKLVTLKKTRFL